MPVRPRTDMEPEPLHARVRWGNVAKAVALLAAVVLIVAWPRLRAPEPELPAGTAVPVRQAPEPIPSPAITEPKEDANADQRAGSGDGQAEERPARVRTERTNKQKRERRPARRRKARPTAPDQPPRPAPAQPAAPSWRPPPRAPGEFSVEG